MAVAVVLAMSVAAGFAADVADFVATVAAVGVPLVPGVSFAAGRRCAVAVDIAADVAVAALAAASFVAAAVAVAALRRAAQSCWAAALDRMCSRFAGCVEWRVVAHIAAVAPDATVAAAALPVVAADSAPADVGDASPLVAVVVVAVARPAAVAAATRRL